MIFSVIPHLYKFRDSPILFHLLPVTHQKKNEAKDSSAVLRYHYLGSEIRSTDG